MKRRLANAWDKATPGERINTILFGVALILSAGFVVCLAAHVNRIVGASVGVLTAVTWITLTISSMRESRRQHLELIERVTQRVIKEYLEEQRRSDQQ
ncbi:MAG TPA: hypothetical protein VLF91_03165 [Candidatus Saccharimonadales bacterium]|nr:hypothetical protein [Candidatus Saccharimonadales bacterium]